MRMPREEERGRREAGPTPASASPCPGRRLQGQCVWVMRRDDPFYSTMPKRTQAGTKAQVPAARPVHGQSQQDGKATNFPGHKRGAEFTRKQRLTSGHANHTPSTPGPAQPQAPFQWIPAIKTSQALGLGFLLLLSKCQRHRLFPPSPQPPSPQQLYPLVLLLEEQCRALEGTLRTGEGSGSGSPGLCTLLYF